jgi:hypothetical protein
MSQETWEIVTKKKVDGIELQLALQCAPLIAGLKVSNLLNIEKQDFPAVLAIIGHSHLRCYTLLSMQQKMTVLLYDPKRLQAYLEQPEVTAFFTENGYESLSMEALLEEFCIRYQRYMEEKKEFPHEMGLLLGYPIEDVNGFIEDGGAHPLCTGYWKVYHNKEKKLRLFEHFENAKESMIQLLSCGVHMADIVEIWCG